MIVVQLLGAVLCASGGLALAAWTRRLHRRFMAQHVDDDEPKLDYVEGKIVVSTGGLAATAFALAFRLVMNAAGR